MVRPTMCRTVTECPTQEEVMPTEHPNTVLSRQHFDLMADQYDDYD
jgi:hypothetical protein